MYTWHWTFAGQHALHRAVRELHGPLAEAGGVDPVEVPWLHLTTQDVGFADEVEWADLMAIAERARRRCAPLAPIDVVLGPPVVHHEAVTLHARPVEPLAEVRTALRAAIAEVRGAGRVRGAEEGWWPHVSVAYVNREGPAEPLVGAVRGGPRIPLTLAEIHLIALERGDHAYTWTDVATVALGGSG